MIQFLPTDVVDVAVHSFPARSFKVVSAADEAWVLLGRDVLNAHRVLLDGPRLFESGLLKHCDSVVVRRGGFKVKEWSGVEWQGQVRPECCGMWGWCELKYADGFTLVLESGEWVRRYDRLQHSYLDLRV